MRSEAGRARPAAWAWAWLERVQAALPLIALAGVAGFSWWLVRSSAVSEPGVAVALKEDTADVELQHAEMWRAGADGRLQMVLQGDRIRHLPVTQRLTVDRIRLQALDETGRTLRAEAREAEVDQRTEVLSMRGDVQALMRPADASGPAMLLGEGLTVDGRQRVLSSSTPVVMLQSGSVLRGQSLRHDERTGITELGGRVTGRYEPAVR